MHDAACDRQVDIAGFARVGKMYGVHGFDIAVDYDGCIGAVALRDAGVSTIKVGPKYILRTGKVNLSAGVDYAYLHDAIYRDRNYLFPAVDLRLDVVKGYFIPYLTAGGEVVSGSFFSLSQRNPVPCGRECGPFGPQDRPARGNRRQCEGKFPLQGFRRLFVFKNVFRFS